MPAPPSPSSPSFQVSVLIGQAGSPSSLQAPPEGLGGGEGAEPLAQDGRGLQHSGRQATGVEGRGAPQSLQPPSPAAAEAGWGACATTTACCQRQELSGALV